MRPWGHSLCESSPPSIKKRKHENSLSPENTDDNKLHIRKKIAYNSVHDALPRRLSDSEQDSLLFYRGIFRQYAENGSRTKTLALLVKKEINLEQGKLSLEDSKLQNPPYNLARSGKRLLQHDSCQASSTEPEQGLPQIAKNLSRAKNKVESMTISERKRMNLDTPTGYMKARMVAYISKIHSLFDDSHNPFNCWLHPSPPSPGRDGRAIGSFRCSFAWEDSSGFHQLLINFGILALCLSEQLTAIQKEGYIMEFWQLSHLCGNWICCNARHFTVESQSINLSRNWCFGSEKSCQHHPPCLKIKKIPLPPTPRKLAKKRKLDDCDDSTGLDGSKTGNGVKVEQSPPSGPYLALLRGMYGP